MTVERGSSVNFVTELGSHFVTHNGAPTPNDFAHAKPPIAFQREEDAYAHIFQFEIVPGPSAWPRSERSMGLRTTNSYRERAPQRVILGLELGFRELHPEAFVSAE